MQRKLVDYEQNFDKINEWIIEFEVGIDYTGRPLQYIKDQHLR